uniref:Unkown protein n=1 Tax=Riptortus pedestris TaxID=329032 RepID=R4WE48_RIPPE|nr:unkown protein [Riptortus pedestris]
MVWWGVCYDGTTMLHFCENGVKTSAKNYQDDILEPVVKPLNETLFAGSHWVFQQDSAPAHKARSTQQWLRGTFLSSSRPQKAPI